jgi:hypothetical protein
MKTRFNLFRRAGVFYTEDTATGKQTSLRTKDETEAKSLLNARNEATRQPVLNLHLARAYLTASDPAFVERTWQTVMEQLQARGKDSSRERYASVFKSPSFDRLRNKKLLETTADDFFAVFKEGKVAISYFLKRLHNFALSLGWIALPVVVHLMAGATAARYTGGEESFPGIPDRIAQHFGRFLHEDERPLPPGLAQALLLDFAKFLDGPRPRTRFVNKFDPSPELKPLGILPPALHSRGDFSELGFRDAVNAPVFE